MKPISRRKFIHGSLLTTAALSLPASAWANINGANNDIRVAVVGFRGQGRGHITAYHRMPGVRVVALCDVDSEILEREAQKFSERNEKVETYTDIRKLLENKDIDAITTATPNHWHALISVWACQAGKDVYVEKPVSHNVWEGRQIVNAARKYNRVVQTGTQCRSSRGLIEAFQWLHEGNLGKIKAVRGLCYKTRNSIGNVDGPQPIPSSVDYDLWCGPADKAPLTRKNLHYDWHWVWATGNGDLGNQGIHQMDLARWILREPALSPRVYSVGGRFGYIDDGETPNTQVVYHDYPSAPLIFEVRGLPTPKYHGADVGVVVDCEGGRMVVPSYTKAAAFDKQGHEIKSWEGGGNHHANFIAAVRSRKSSDLAADILEGHLSSALCHTGNISYLLGSQKEPGEIEDIISGDKEMVESSERAADHLEENGIDLGKTKPIMGMVLKMDPKTETFKGNAAANELLTRKYRKPFVVPEKV
jgi:predicted dehydrogenase